jgi:hypothetical protein
MLLPSSKVTLVRLVQSLNALSPMEITPAGMGMLLRRLHPKNALYPME